MVWECEQRPLPAPCNYPAHSVRARAGAAWEAVGHFFMEGVALNSKTPKLTALR